MNFSFGEMVKAQVQERRPVAVCTVHRSPCTGFQRASGIEQRPATFQRGARPVGTDSAAHPTSTGIATHSHSYGTKKLTEPRTDGPRGAPPFCSFFLDRRFTITTPTNNELCPCRIINIRATAKSQ